MNLASFLADKGELERSERARIAAGGAGSSYFTPPGYLIRDSPSKTNKRGEGGGGGGMNMTAPPAAR